MSKKEEVKENPMNEVFMVTYICREDLLHPVVGFTKTEASMVSDEQMKMIAKKLANHNANQILKSSLKLVAEDVISNKTK